MDKVTEVTKDKTREQLAAYAHKAWSGWIKYMFSKGTIHKDGSLTLPAESVERWTRQSNTEYENLPENEKISDRKEASAIMELITEFIITYGGQ